MAGDDEVRARAALDEMQLRIAEGPFAVLGLSEYAGSEDVRAAFLALTKQYHPARFGRMATEIQKYANEVFLGIKSAHDHLQRVLGGGTATRSGHAPYTVDTQRGTGAPASTQPIRRTDQMAPLQRQTGPIPRQTPNFAHGTDRPPSAPMNTPPHGLSRPMTTPSQGMQRPSSPPMNTPPHGMQRPTTPGPAQPQRPSTPAMSRTATPIAGPRTTPATGFPVQRPGSPPAAGRPTTPQPAQPRPTSPVRVQSPSTPPMMPPKPSSALDPPTIRGTTPAPVFDERTALRECMMMLNDRRWTDARIALHNLAAKVPQSKTYRAMLCYARGREAHVAGRTDEAQLEYQRALQLDPALDLAGQALSELSRRR